MSGDIARNFPELDILAAVHRGELDAGFVRADNILKSALANLTGEALFKVIGLVDAVLPGTGAPYPFPLSTPLYPEWALVAFPAVASDFKWAVISALLRIDGSSPEAAAGNYDSWELALEYASVGQANIPPFISASV